MHFIYVYLLFFMFKRHFEKINFFDPIVQFFLDSYYKNFIKKYNSFFWGASTFYKMQKQNFK